MDGPDKRLLVLLLQFFCFYSASPASRPNPAKQIYTQLLLLLPTLLLSPSTLSSSLSLSRPLPTRLGQRPPARAGRGSGRPPPPPACWLCQHCRLTAPDAGGARRCSRPAARRRAWPPAVVVPGHGAARSGPDGGWPLAWVPPALPPPGGPRALDETLAAVAQIGGCICRYVTVFFSYFLPCLLLQIPSPQSDVGAVQRTSLAP